MGHMIIRSMALYNTDITSLLPPWSYVFFALSYLVLGLNCFIPMWCVDFRTVYLASAGKCSLPDRLIHLVISYRKNWDRVGFSYVTRVSRELDWGVPKTPVYQQWSYACLALTFPTVKLPVLEMPLCDERFVQKSMHKACRLYVNVICYLRHWAVGILVSHEICQN